MSYKSFLDDRSDRKSFLGFVCRYKKVKFIMKW